MTAGSPEVVIAIVDSGVEAAHPDLAGSVRPGYDFVERDDVAAPVDAHGTGVTAAAAARAENAIGGVGACFRCTILPLQVVGPDGIALNVHIAEAIDYAVDHRAAVVNVSLVAPNSPPELERAVTRARAAGILVVAAAGNEGRDVPHFPAATRGAISVAASTYDGRRAGFSNYGTWVKFAAPECAPIAVLGGGSGVGCGTSMAAPLVAGIIALMRTRAPYATSDEIESSLARASRFVSDTRYGVPDAAAALREVGSAQPRLRPVVLGHPAVGHTLEAFSGLWVGSGARRGVPVGALSRGHVHGDRRRDGHDVRPWRRRRGAPSSRDCHRRADRDEPVPSDRGRREPPATSREAVDRRHGEGRQAAGRTHRTLDGREPRLHDHLAALRAPLRRRGRRAGPSRA